MGLFTNDKKPCPVCGNGTPKLLATKISDERPICSSCEKKISIQGTLLEKISVEGVKEHFVLREENAKYIENIFRPTKQIEIDFTSLNIDEVNQVFTIPLNMCGDTDNPPVFKFEELIGYELLAKPQVVERFHKGDVSPEYIPLVFKTLTHFFDDNSISLDSNCHFSLILYLTNPCWSEIKVDAGLTSKKFNIKRNINDHLERLQIVTTALLEIMGYSVGDGASIENEDGIPEELMKFKELLDGSVITQEEFDEKEREFSEASEDVEVEWFEELEGITPLQGGTSNEALVDAEGLVTVDYSDVTEEELDAYREALIADGFELTDIDTGEEAYGRVDAEGISYLVILNTQNDKEGHLKLSGIITPAEELLK